MPWGAQQWLRITRETTYGVRQGSPSGSDVAWVRLYQANPFTLRKVPQRQVIRSADASNRRRQVVAARSVYAGALNTLLYPTQASFFMTALASVGNTYTNDLNSYTIDYYDSTRTIGILGCKFQQGTITSTAQADYVTLGLSIVGQVLDATMTSLTQPVDGNFPTETPYEHYLSAGNMTVGGSVLTKYSSTVVTINNVMAPTWDEQPYITSLIYCGRDVDFNFRAQYLSAAFRTSFEAQSPLTCSLNWTQPVGSHSVTLNAQTKSYIGSITDELPLDNVAYQQIAFQSFYDTSNSTDLVVSVV